MTGLEIIKEIRRLPPEEQAKVKRFVAENLQPGQISSEELGELTRRFIDANDPAEAERLKNDLMRGFYGNEPHA